MDNAIRHYADIVASGGWRVIPPGPPLQTGVEDDRVMTLRNRLQITGDLPDRDEFARSYDARTERGVMRFQTGHGLPPTAIVDKRTLAAMNVPARVRLRQLQLNRDRLHELLPENNKARMIVVNIPAFELQAIGADSEIEFRARVIAGKAQTPTPDLVASVKALNFNPYWHVPMSVVKNSLIP